MNAVHRGLSFRLSLLVAACTTLSVPLAWGDIIVASDAGFVTEMGGSAKGDGTVTAPAKYNYSVGRELHYSDGALFSPLAPMDRKNYFVFDLTSVTSPIVSAVLHLYAGPSVGPPFPGGMHGYESGDPTETYAIAATMDSAGALADATALAGGIMADFDMPGDPLVGVAKALYMKLAAGPMPLAAAVLSPATDGTTVDLVFSPDGLAYLNSFLGMKVVIGGKLPTAIPPATPQSVFGFTGPSIPGDPLTPTLEITAVPELSGALLMSAAMGLIGMIAWRRRSVC